MSRNKWYVFENLNNPRDRIVVNGKSGVAAVYRQISGPHKSEAEAKLKAKS